MHVVKLASNGGQNAVPGAVSADPVHATGQTATDAAADGGDHTLTVTGGKSYLIMATDTGNILLGILTTATAANIAWMCPKSKAIVVNMPEGENTLHYQSDTNGGTFYLTEIKRNPLNV